MMDHPRYGAVLPGAFAGGMDPVNGLTMSLPHNFRLPLIAVLHTGAAWGPPRVDIFDDRCRIHVNAANEKDCIEPGVVDLTPADYHLFVESDQEFTLTADDRVNYACPLIDALFGTAAQAYRERLIGIVGTKANCDGAKGLLRVRQRGGLTIVQYPASATMPDAVIRTATPRDVFDPDVMLAFLHRIHSQQSNAYETTD